MTEQSSITEPSPETPRLLCSFSADSAARALSFAAKDDIRFYLNGINVRPCGSGVVVCGTDGHVCYSEEDFSGTGDVEITVKISTRSKSILRRGNRVIVEGTSKEATLTILDGDQKVIYIEPGNAVFVANYPPFEKVFGDPSTWVEGISGAFRTDLLKKIVTNLGAVRFYRPAAECNGQACNFFLFRGPTGEKGVGGIMPYRALETVQSSIPAIYLAA